MKNKASLGEIEKTNRGFEILEFIDRYGEKCSLQQSSLAEYEQPGISAVWLGVHDAVPKQLIFNQGYVPVELPKDVLTASRMHLDRKQVKALIRHLRLWLKNGSFEEVK